MKIKEGIKGASKGYFPISLEKLKDENKQLYDIIAGPDIGQYRWWWHGCCMR